MWTRFKQDGDIILTSIVDDWHQLFYPNFTFMWWYRCLNGIPVSNCFILDFQSSPLRSYIRRHSLLLYCSISVKCLVVYADL